MNLNTTPIAIHASTTHPSYRSSSSVDSITKTPKKDYIFQSQTSSINLKPVHIAFSETKNRKETQQKQQKYDVIDIANLKTASTNLNKDIENISTHNHNNRHYRNNPNNDNELFELCKWCLFCLAALASCIIFISYLLQITGVTNFTQNDHKSRYKNNNKKFLPHHMDSHYGYHQIEGSIANTYMRPRKSLHMNNIAHKSPASMLHPRTNVHTRARTVHQDQELKYHLVRNDKYSILDDILFLVFKSSMNVNDSDGRDIILKTWGKKYKDLYDINIKFVNTAEHKFIGDIHVYDDVIEAPFDGDSAMCLLWVIDEYTDGYKWIFKVDDITFVMIENLVDYLNEIELESSLLTHDYYWWLGNRLQQDKNDASSIFTSGAAGYLLNRAILDVIVDDLRNNTYGINKYMMCKQYEIHWEDLCIAYLLQKYNIYSTVTLDMDENEKFNVWDPMTLFGFGGIYKLPIDWYTKYKRNVGQIVQKEGINYISKTPITFHYVQSEWMEAYYDLFYLHKNAKDIEIIVEKIGDNKNGEQQIEMLNEYAQIVTQYSLTNHIKNIKNEMQHVTTDLNYNMVKEYN